MNYQTYNCFNCGEFTLFQEHECCPSCMNEMDCVDGGKLDPEKVVLLQQHQSSVAMTVLKNILVLTPIQDKSIYTGIYYTGKEPIVGYFESDFQAINIMIGLGFSSGKERVLYRDDPEYTSKLVALLAETATKIVEKENRKNQHE